MSLPVVCVLGSVLLWLLAAPARAGRVGEAFSFANRLVAHQAEDVDTTSHTLEVTLHVASYTLPDTTRRVVSTDTTRRPALVPDTTTVPDDDKPARKTTLLTVLAIAVLTISTLLLYNVRSR